MSPSDPTSELVTDAHAEKVMNAFYEILSRAALDPHVGQRLALANTICQVHLSDAPGHSLTVFLDRAPIEVEMGAVGEAETHLRIATDDVLRFWAGSYHLAIGILNGEVDYDGPIHKVLRVVPIARRMAAQFAEVLAEGDLDRPETVTQLDPYADAESDEYA